MLDKLRKIVAEQLNIDESEINENTNFKDDLGFDSLELFELVITLEEEYDLDIPDEDAVKLETLNDVMEYLKNKGMDI